MTLKEKGLAIIKKLVADFDKNLDYVKSENVKEDVIRIDFIDPFFEALGWDIRNKNGQLPTEREVYYEDAVLVERRKKQPDYGFTKKGEHRFFVEAKKPSIFLPDSSLSALQLRSYGWSKQLKISVLTNFEHFVIYDCNIEPQATDVANIAALKTIHYKDYEKNFEYLWTHFAKENIYNGNFDALFDKIVAKGTMTVDKAFLRTLELQRDYLAKGIITKNPQIDEDDLNFLVQNILDRIIFLRICEDREVEPNDQLKQTIKTGNAYQNLVQLFKSSAEKYNSSLFDFEKDVLSPSIEIDNKVIQYVIGDLYFPKSPYQFSVIGTEILGTAYERFLGKIITITKAKSVEIDEKPEVRKAGGVYYTPQYIVNEIVKQTIGKKIAGKTPKEIEDLSILDPSCGSGSFLLGAYQFLLDWYLNYYYQQKLAKPKDKTYGQNYENVLTQDDKLRTEEKKRILLAHIYGVDIDLQAVEVTKLSLALKAMEGETVATINTQLKFFKRRVLPNLDNNVQCGNSLISPDFYEIEMFLTPKERRKINVFDWKVEFKEVIKKGGFDVIIGNPPYVFTRDVPFSNEMKEYYKSKYFQLLTKSANVRENQTGKVNLYALFILKSLQFLKPNGEVGLIIPNTILRTTVYEGVRKYLLDNASIEKIIDLKEGVFDQVTVSTVILFLGKDKTKTQIEIIDNIQGQEKIEGICSFIDKSLFYKNASYAFNIFENKEDTLIFDKIRSKSINLSELVTVSNGIATFKDMEGIFDTKVNENCKKLLLGRNIARYHHEWSGKYVEYVSKKLQRARDEQIFLAQEKLIMQRIGGILITSYDNEQYYTFNSVNNLLARQAKYSLKYILAILNSNLMIFYYIKNFTNKSKLTVNISKTFLDKLPIAEVDFTDKMQKTCYEKIVKYVDTMLDLQKQLLAAKLNSQKVEITRLITYTESQINENIYKLYDLTPEEIATIEV